MRLHELIKKDLDKKEIIGKDGKKYIIQIFGEGTFSICVFDMQEKGRYGFFPDLRDLGTELYAAGVVEFMAVQGNGLYKKTLRLISEAVPVGTSYRSIMQNLDDQKALLEYVANNGQALNVMNALEKTCLGHVLLASEFNNIQLFYKNQVKIHSGTQALDHFSNDQNRGIFTSSHGTDLYLIATKSD